MNSVRVPAMSLAVLGLAFLLFVANSASELPERVATHFGIDGRPNGWMSRSGYVGFVSVMGIALPLVIVGLCSLSRFLPAWMVNIPHREHWLGPERRDQTFACLLRHCLWLACLLVCFFGALHYLTIQANHSIPVRLPAGAFLATVGGFFAGVGLWCVGLVRRFTKPV